MSIDIRETKELNHKRKSDTLDEMLSKLEIIEDKIDRLAYDKTGKIDETIRYVHSSVSRIDNKIYEEMDNHMRKVLLRVFQITGAIIICTPAVIVIIWWLLAISRIFT